MASRYARKNSSLRAAKRWLVDEMEVMEALTATRRLRPIDTAASKQKLRVLGEVFPTVAVDVRRDVLVAANYREDVAAAMLGDLAQEPVTSRIQEEAPELLFVELHADDDAASDVADEEDWSEVAAASSGSDAWVVIQDDWEVVDKDGEKVRTFADVLQTAPLSPFSANTANPNRPTLLSRLSIVESPPRAELLLEDCRAGAGPGLRLTANSSTGGVAIEQLASSSGSFDGVQPSEDAASVPIHAVYGVYSLLSGPYLAVVTDSRVVGSGPNSEKIYCILELTLLPVSSAAHQSFFKHASPREKQDEKEYCRMLKSVLASRTFYFSYDLDLTLSAQKRALASASSSAAQRQSPLYARAEEDFFWNKPVLGPFIEMELSDWIVPVISGFVKVIKKCDVNGQRCDILFFTRRSWRRVGTRFNVRGVDKDGCVANFAETEMLLVKPSRAMCSYVQVRGSIPLYWDQMVTLKYMPRTRYAFSGHESVVDWNELAFRAHMDNLIQRYGHITCVNLIDRSGKSATVRDQAQLGSSFGKYVKKYNQQSRSADGSSSVGSSTASPMAASAAIHAMSPRQHKSLSVSPSMPPSNANGFGPSNGGGGSGAASPTSASTASNDKGSVSSGTPTLQSSLSLPPREHSPLHVTVLSAPTSISQLFAEPVAYVWFDFHHECRKMAWHNLSKLMTEVEEQFTQYGWFECDGEGRLLQRQRGVFRVNCMDNLDRTNVVMSLFARRTVLMALQLHSNSAEKGSSVLDSPYESFELVFKNAWADNADYVSRMYAGTGALKTDFTRTGRRTLTGALQDGVNSVTRYYLNNFADGIRQDAYDLLVGNFTPDKRDESPFNFQQQHSMFNLMLEATLATFAVMSMSLSIRPDVPVATRVRDGVVTAFALFAVTGYLILKKVRINMPWFRLHNRDLSPTGSFANNQSMIVFYTNESCTGTFRVGGTAEKNFPTNFALDGIDNQIPSLMVRKTTKVMNP
ncbi:hypothetical protein BBJ29_006583 [Phytophthora kernoviae]|uniref:SAC domain-containing protein n=2 Tax=Phytophthora kernoviae TaxID=325452 RepID=A0A421G958_9STRA|nr:hypothetical protein BBJ29_006583 [Phytophthora kernoviae]